MLMLFFSKAKTVIFKKGIKNAPKGTLQGEFIKRLQQYDIFEPYRVCRRPLFLRECPDEKTKIYS